MAILFLGRSPISGSVLKLLFSALLLLTFVGVPAQNDSLKKLTFSGYADLYYSFDFANPGNHVKDPFIYHYKRHNEVNLNLAIAKASFTSRQARANLALMAGNYPQYNYQNEPTWARFVYEASIGVKLSREQQIYLDAGIMPSHIGFESAISADCWTLTRSILADNSPYYEAGIKASFLNKKENLSIAALLLNGWQRIRRSNGMQRPSLGMQLNFKPRKNLVLNYSNFIGSDQPDSMNAIRTYHNFFMQFEPSAKTGLILGFDIGTDKFNSTDYGIWYSPVLILRYALAPKMKFALRGEYYSDKHQILLSANSINGFRTAGFSVNMDYQILPEVAFRIEGKMYHSPDPIFSGGSRKDYSLTAQLTVKL